MNTINKKLYTFTEHLIDHSIYGRIRLLRFYFTITLDESFIDRCFQPLNELQNNVWYIGIELV